MSGSSAPTPPHLHVYPLPPPIPHLKADRLEASPITVLGRAGRHPDDQLVERRDREAVAGPTRGREHGELAVGGEADVHEDVEGRRDVVGGDAEVG